MSQTENYTSASRDMLRKAREALAQDDLVQASEKGWGAAARIVKGVAADEGGGTMAIESFLRRFAASPKRQATRESGRCST